MSGTLSLSFYTLSVLISPHTPSNSVLVFLSPYTASTTFWSFYSPHTASTTSWFFYHPTLFRQHFGPYITPHCCYTLSVLLSSNTASNLFQSFYHPRLLLHLFGSWSLYHPTLLHPFSPSITPPASTTFWPFAAFRPSSPVVPNHLSILFLRPVNHSAVFCSTTYHLFILRQPVGLFAIYSFMAILLSLWGRTVRLFACRYCLKTH